MGCREQARRRRRMARHNHSIRGRYIGAREWMRGQTALLHIDDPNSLRVTAQFDNVAFFGAPCEGHLGYGWHPFKGCEFEVLN